MYPMYASTISHGVSPVNMRSTPCKRVNICNTLSSNVPILVVTNTENNLSITTTSMESLESTFTLSTELHYLVC